MVEKNVSQCEKSEKDDDSNNTESDSNTIENTFHEQNLYVASFPLIASFAFLNYLSYLLLLLFRSVWNHILKLKSLIRRPLWHQSTPVKSVVVPNVQKDTEMPRQAAGIENQLLKQKTHHRKAFEYISMALKIDEENEGRYCCRILPVCSRIEINDYSV